MSYKSKAEYLESCRLRYVSRNRVGKSAMIDAVSDTLGWNRKHTIKALNGKVALGLKAKKRGSKSSYGYKPTESILRGDFTEGIAPGEETVHGVDGPWIEQDKGGQAAFVAKRFPRSFDPISFFNTVGTVDAVGCLYLGAVQFHLSDFFL